MASRSLGFLELNLICKTANLNLRDGFDRSITLIFKSKSEAFGFK